METTVLGFTFFKRKQFVWKTVLLAATTLALVPVLLSKSEEAAMIYLAALIFVHVAGFFVIAYGAKKHHIAPDRRGLVIRVVGILILTGLLYLAADGLKTQAADLVFWLSLFAIWALHTVGLLFLHVRSRREASVCPFV